MKTEHPVSEYSIPPERLAEAGVWVARLHSDDCDGAMRTGFKQWLNAHPLNAAAFELTTEVWEEAHALRQVMPLASERSPSTTRRFLVTGFAVAAAMILVAVTLVFFRQSDVTTSIGEQRSLALEDGTRVFLNTATRIRVHYDKNARQIEVLSGEVFCDVAKRPDWPFLVEAGGHRVRALGTSFAVRYESGRTAVTLVEGKVSVASGKVPPLDNRNLDTQQEPSQSGEVINLVAGQRLSFDANQNATLDTPVLENVTAWRRGKVVLDDTRLADAIVEMNRYSKTKLAIERAETAQLRVNGLFQAGDSLSFAKAIAQAYGLGVVEKPGEILITGLPRT
jgi:transmembrane sensor